MSISYFVRSGVYFNLVKLFFCNACFISPTIRNYSIFMLHLSEENFFAGVFYKSNNYYK